MEAHFSERQTYTDILRLSYTEIPEKRPTSVSNSKPPVIFLHGVLASGTTYHSVLARDNFVPDRRVYALDLRNHGSSPHSSVMNYKVFAEDVIRFLKDHGISRSVIIGHSMGGKVGMKVALEYPQLVSELVVVDLAPIDYSDPVFVKNLPTDAIVAMSKVNPESCTERWQVDDLLKQNGVQNKRVRDFILENLIAHDVYPGHFKWRVNVSALLKSMDKILESPVKIGQVYNGPTLFIRGERSIYVMNSAAEKAIRDFFPNAIIETIAGAGHWLTAEEPEKFCTVVNNFLYNTNLKIN
ncbi:hydrolase, alpha/beta fold family protein [Galdieria sulphuraria]|uniref:Hydrolase, alpha/beta fold family protein n=1 Tax=Galdieria sulphuraria TaxID=130081 RepID=M2Y623_GALSU|nr:hydrolase, alpha/beta fold family protein [Galdieria sulphuraria]EME31304.1 hydrolase, alpha/beta fold family protein [Galdieria sulphuraria]|eukprot:XP_005707824.1 hydrolase, alpha/beta fold family protein [Galdieria sulphuraria]